MSELGQFQQTTVAIVVAVGVFIVGALGAMGVWFSGKLKASAEQSQNEVAEKKANAQIKVDTQALEVEHEKIGLWLTKNTAEEVGKLRADNLERIKREQDMKIELLELRHKNDSLQKDLDRVTASMGAEQALRLKSDTENASVIKGLEDKITFLTEQLAKAEKRNDDLAAELADVKQQFNALLQTRVQTQAPIPTPALAPATEAKET